MTLLEQFYMWLKTLWTGFEWAAYLIPALVGIIGILAFILIMVIVFIYIERRLLARFQIRLGPNRLGPEGILQPIATALKVLLKEDIVPTKADKVVHFLAPLVVFIPILLIFAVVPLDKGAIFVDLNVGIVYIVAISSLSTVGIFMAGWGSNSKYALLAAMRTVAQMVSYEFPIVLSIVGVVLMAGSLSMSKIVESQTIPFFVMQPLGFIIFFIGALAEMNRCPFDLLEADSEIVAGYHTEYSGMKFAMFYLGEYGHAVLYTAVISTLFLGGWQGPLLPPIIWLLIKMILVFFVIVWIRSTLPRMRVDQLMSFAWKALLPMSIINLFIVAAEKLWLPGSLPWLMIIINFILAGVLVMLWSRLFTLGGGRVEV
jgi:NADH-quinone oxidoreductase subunit H